MKWLYNQYANDGTEFIIFFDRGTHVLKHYDGDDDINGKIVTTGSYDKCHNRMMAEWAEIGEALIG